MKVEASAPSNIALIKYMGKEPGGRNRPANPSLSYTLEHLRSFVTLEKIQELMIDEWLALPGFEPIELSQVGLKKFMEHFMRLKLQWKIPGNYRVQSANNFPADCGLASSASSFAALTLAAYSLAQAHDKNLECTREELSQFSRLGSGSSCRSMFSPWAEWSGEGAEGINVALELEHAVILVDGDRKSVSSSEAHARVNTSLLWPGRPDRAWARLKELKTALSRQDWRSIYDVCWSEFWDMHALFETSKPSFGFMSRGTLDVLDQLRQLWLRDKDGPIVTMDAGANVHLLLRSDQIGRANTWLSGYKTLRSWSE